jgi:predicted nucleotidyltransferase
MLLGSIASPAPFPGDPTPGCPDYTRRQSDRDAYPRYNPTMQPEEVIEAIAAHQLDLRQFDVKSLSLFGSVARGEAGPESDIDLLVEFNDTPTFRRYIGLKHFLEDLLGSRIDLVMKDALKPRMRPSVEREAVRVA